MQYAQIYLRGVRDIYTWENIPRAAVGDRVLVPFRKKKKIGLVVKLVSTPPPKKAQPVIKIIEPAFINPQHIHFALSAAQYHFCHISKVLNLMIPKEYFQKEYPVKTIPIWKKHIQTEILRGVKQKIVLEELSNCPDGVLETILLQSVPKSVLKNMAQKGYIYTDAETIPNPLIGITERPFHALNQVQAKAVKSCIESPKPTLLWGVTGSGKTEIYKHCIKSVIENGKTALLMVPEIGLTPQLIGEMKGFFGDAVGVWHSAMSPTEKLQTFARIQKNICRVIVGVRSSVWLPLNNLGIVIVDEEHEWTYHNQQLPRYNVHTILEQKRTQNPKLKLVFGTATPRAETYYKTQNGTYNLVQLTERISKSPMPPIQMIDMKNAYINDPKSPISAQLLASMRATVMAGDTVVLFLNKRGMFQSLLCKACGEHAHCKNCDARVKLHQRGSVQIELCHICGSLKKHVNKCESCKTENYHTQGWGTQGIESYLKAFPEFKVVRADADTTGPKNALQAILEQIRSKQANVLLGTQMIAKGLDFADVTLVGILNADVGLSLPDFRSEERVFQLLTQVSGRAGRRKKKAQIYIQTFTPEHRVFTACKNYNTKSFLDVTLKERKDNNWPPFSPIIKLTYTDPSKEIAFHRIKQMASTIESMSDMHIEWAPAFMPRSHNKYHFHIFMRPGEMDSNPHKWLDKHKLKLYLDGFKIDPNPISLL